MNKSVIDHITNVQYERKEQIEKLLDSAKDNEEIESCVSIIFKEWIWRCTDDIFNQKYIYYKGDLLFENLVKIMSAGNPLIANRRMLCESIVTSSRYISFLKHEGNLENIFKISTLLKKDFSGYELPISEEEIKTMCQVKGLISLSEVLVYLSMRQICSDLDDENSFDWLGHFSKCMNHYSDSMLIHDMKSKVEESEFNIDYVSYIELVSNGCSFKNKEYLKFS
jgi:hypothetical protein